MKPHDLTPESHDLIVRIITPVHVGGAQEKHLQNELDFVINGNKMFILNQEKVVNKIGIDRYAASMLDGTLSQFLKKLKVEELADNQQTITGQADEARVNIHSVLGHRTLLLPGSSLKGSIRSMLASSLGMENDELGKYEKSFMRFFQVTDAHFSKSIFYNSKVFNVIKQRDEWHGAWKHMRIEGNTSAFRTSGFTTLYECISPDSVGHCRINFRISFLEGEQGKNAPKVQSLLNGNFTQQLFQIIHAHTKRFLERELKFFSTKASGADYVESIEGIFHKLVGENQPQAPLLRLGSGSGFHSVTGDMLGSHDINNIISNGRRSRGRLNDQPSAKSRRFAFEYHGRNMLFYPMGYVQMTTPEYYNTYIKPSIDTHQEAEETESAGKAIKQTEPAKQPPQPVWINLQQLSRKNFTNIYAEVMKMDGLHVLLKPLVKEYSGPLITVRYPAGFNPGTIVTIQVKLEGNNLAVSGYPRQL